MKDYQILIDLTWSQNPDIFGLIRKYLQDHLDNRRPFIAEFQGLLHHRWGGGAGNPILTINDLFIRSKMNCMRALLPTKISRNISQLHPSTLWTTPIDTIHSTQSHPNQVGRVRALIGQRFTSVFATCDSCNTVQR